MNTTDCESVRSADELGGRACGTSAPRAPTTSCIPSIGCCTAASSIAVRCRPGRSLVITIRAAFRRRIDATLLARLPTAELRRCMAQRRIEDHATAPRPAPGGVARLGCTWPREWDLIVQYVESTNGLLPGTRFAVDAYVNFVRGARSRFVEAVASSLTEMFSPTIISERVSRHAAQLRFRHRRHPWRTLRPGSRRRRATVISPWRMSSKHAPHRSVAARSRCWRRCGSNATYCGRNSMRCTSPMSSPVSFLRALSSRRTTSDSASAPKPRPIRELCPAGQGFHPK